MKTYISIEFINHPSPCSVLERGHSERKTLSTGTDLIVTQYNRENDGSRWAVFIECVGDLNNNNNQHLYSAIKSEDTEALVTSG